ncbi:MAG TPA: amidase [Acetobacteraceae bacterium]|nr:amidase [Acetobacteraceae bacterium]
MREAVVDQQLAALARRDSTVRAFVCLDAAGARRRALAATGPFAGVLIGVKDIIATAEFPTRYGMDVDDAGPREDAWCVARIRQLGGTVLGKTVCTAFAYPLPGPTTNPHDVTRTPGGSSSGSAAAVAAGFVSFALGTQTAGSTIRPASYCGVTGFKPSYGLMPLDGVQAISTTLDHLGLFAHSPRDAWYLASAMIMPQAEVVTARRPRRLLVLRFPPELPVSADYVGRLEALADTLRGEAIEVNTRDLPFPMDDFRSLQSELCYWEAARILLSPGRVRPVPELQALLAPYRDRDVALYAAARRRRGAYRAQFTALVAGYDAVMLPAATGVAPPVADTGDAVMNRFWTALHVPAITIPMWRSGDGLPLGLQLLSGLGTDRALIEVAQWIFERPPRHCEERSDEAIQPVGARPSWIASSLRSSQ